MAKNITMDNFKQEVIETDKPVLLDFWASWCAPCRMLGPSIDKLTEEYADTAVIGKVNIDEQRELAEHFGVMSIPSVFVIKNGKVIDSAVGVRPKEYYKGVLDKAISN
ncbi:MAG: thioredoxin [Eubacteriales bacterium]|nr:thioredoxin [Eubacteriales bacterium]